MRTTTIHVTHDQQEAVALADVIVVMREGRTEQPGASLDLFTRPATDFVAGFLGDPPYSLVDAEVGGIELGLRARIAGTALPLPDSMRTELSEGVGVRLGLRPKHSSIASFDDRDAIAGSVHSHERAGSERQLLMQVDGRWLRLRTRDRLSVRAGEQLWSRLDPDEAQVFDQATGRALTAAVEAPLP